MRPTTARSTLLAASLLALLSACGGGGGDGGAGGGSGGGDNRPPPPVQTTVEHRVAGEAIVKVRGAGSGWVALAETLEPSFVSLLRPVRRLVIAEGAAATSAYNPPAGWSLLDFAVHPSREISVVIATDSEVRLLRLDRRGVLLSQLDFQDAAIPNDPFYSDPLSIPNHKALLPKATRDGVRLAPVGEDLAMALHTGRNSILAYRYSYGAGGFARNWRTLVEPGVFIGGRSVISGTFDPYGGLYEQWQVLLDADASGRIAVGVNLNPTEYAAAHAEHFKESLPAELYSGALVTELAADGRRVGTSYLEPRTPFELKAVKWHGNAIVAVGRVLPVRLPDGFGWDGMLSVIPAGSKGKAGYRTLDIDRGDVLLDATSLPDGRLLVAGSSGYFQNPNGASISEDVKPLLAVLEPDGRLREQLPAVKGPRHNQVRSVAPWNGSWLAGSMENGPGTHSADADAALLRADGHVRSVRVP
ncbi:hypothetical protein [Massilia sp. 9I]|uniref:hypothetical protein n=1 Tax=Massilia sp. 9I TaxID=2653152 RepID=UPI0012F3EDC9|nr:hypothetical protein [Massilia sp. 9I]VXB21386.1 conserved exported hypothetical protein [Massilia sp. 9I]